MKLYLPAVFCAAALITAMPGPTLVHADEDQASAVPAPDAVTHDWQFDFKFAKPDTIAIEENDGSTSWYWYMTYKVTNYDYDQLFFDPKIVIRNNIGEIITANLGIDAKVFNEVRNLVRNPLLISPLEVPGKVLKGDDYARQSVIIWKASKKDIDAFTVFVGGIYGEQKIVNDPSTGKPIMIPVIDPITGEPKKDRDGKEMMQPLLVSRTKMLSYETPGTVISLESPSIKLKEHKDVMR